jgi:tetratricopeptide (TPR) repeat protein
LAPGRDDAYRLLSAQMLRQGRGREAHGIALAGLARAGFHPDLWGAVSESYILKGDLQAALSARQAAVAADPESRGQWDRLADILQALDRGEEAAAAREQARRLGAEVGPDDPDDPSFQGPLSGKLNSEEGRVT